MRYLIFLIFLTGCAGEKAFKPQLSIETDFDEYVRSFEYESNRFNHPIKVTNLIMIFGNTIQFGENVVGYCERRKTPVVVISPEFWDESTYYERENLVFHELGHCVLNRDHNDAYMGIYPQSIMNTYLIDEWIYVSYRDYYLNELFNLH